MTLVGADVISEASSRNGTAVPDAKPFGLRVAESTGSSSVIDQLHELFRHRDLLILWTMRDIRVRYKQSVLGVAWAILQPLSIMLIFTVIFSYIARMPSDGVPYPLFSFAALLSWTLLATAFSTAVPSLVTNMNLVSKVYFPREILPIAAVLASLVDFLVACLVFVPMMIYYQVPLSWTILTVPLIVVVQLALILGMTMWAAALNVFYRDIRFVVPLATQLWMYVTPVIYPVSLVPERFRWLYMMNPMASLVDGYRRTLLLHELPDFTYLALAALVSLLSLWMGYRYFKQAEARFADLI